MFIRWEIGLALAQASPPTHGRAMDALWSCSMVHARTINLVSPKQRVSESTVFSLDSCVTTAMPACSDDTRLPAVSSRACYERRGMGVVDQPSTSAPYRGQTVLIFTLFYSLLRYGSTLLCTIYSARSNKYSLRSSFTAMTTSLGDLTCLLARFDIT